MSIKTIPGSPELAKDIRDARTKLGLTIEEAAHIAGVGTKTWSRYEAGESIRKDKWPGICKALNWKGSPLDGDINDYDIDINKCHQSVFWSSFLERKFGEAAAVSFVIGGEMLLDHINADMEELAVLPRGTHLGELEFSFLLDDLPSQFLTRYDYEFLFALRSSLYGLIKRTGKDEPMGAYTVMEELVYYLISVDTTFYLDLCNYMNAEYDEEWVYELFEEEWCLDTYLYSEEYLTEDNKYHFNHWMERQFWMGK